MAGIGKANRQMGQKPLTLGHFMKIWAIKVMGWAQIKRKTEMMCAIRGCVCNILCIFNVLYMSKYRVFFAVFLFLTIFAPEGYGIFFAMFEASFTKHGISFKR